MRKFFRNGLKSCQNFSKLLCKSCSVAFRCSESLYVIGSFRP